MRQKKLTLALMVLLTVSLLLSGCFGPSSKSPPASPRGITGTITTGKSVPAATASISPVGGTVTVTDPSNPLAGLEVRVPPNSYGAATQFKVSAAPIEKHTFGEDFNPISPLIQVDNGGGYSDEAIEVKIPVKIPEGQFAMGFLYDDKTGQLEGLPLLTQDVNSITIATRHFSNIVVGAVNPARLQGDISSGFTPGTDDWQFTNRGSYLAPKGHCAGQSLTAMWYYITRPDGEASHLFGRYDNNGDEPATPDFWQDDSLGYRFSSVVQEDSDWDGQAYRFFYQKAKDDPKKIWEAFAYSMKLPGHRPQLVAVFNTQNHTGHALIAYKISGNKLYVADPNYPGKTDRFIEFVNGKFKPYNSGANAEDIAAGKGKEYDLIAYAGMTAVVDWGNIGRRWGEVKNGTIGDDSFLSYKTVWLDSQGDAHELTDGLTVSENKLNIGFDYQGGISSTWSVFRDGERLQSGRRVFPGTSNYELKPGNNKLGILLNAVIDGKERYIDFKYVNVVYNEAPQPSAKVWTLAETIINPPGGSLSQPARVRNDYTVTTDRITHKTSFESTSFGWNVMLTFTFSKPPATMKPGDLVNLQATGTLSRSGNLPSNPFTYGFSYGSGYWVNNTLQSEGGSGYPQLSSGGGSPGISFEAHENVTNKNVGVSFVVPEAHQRDIAIQAREGNVSVTWVYRAK